MDLLSISATQALLNNGALLIDTRPTSEFTLGFIPKSLHLPLGEKFADYAAAFITTEDQVVVITKVGEEEQAYRAIAKTGFINIAGIVEGGYTAMITADMDTDLLIDISLDEFEIDYKFDEFYLIDIRNEEEYEQEHIEYAENIPLADLDTALADLNSTSLYYIYGNSGTEATIAATIFKQYDFHKLRVITEGYEQLKQSTIPITKMKKEKADNSFSAN